MPKNDTVAMKMRAKRDDKQFVRKVYIQHPGTLIPYYPPVGANLCYRY